MNILTDFIPPTSLQLKGSFISEKFYVKQNILANK